MQRVVVRCSSFISLSRCSCLLSQTGMSSPPGGSAATARSGTSLPYCNPRPADSRPRAIFIPRAVPPGRTAGVSWLLTCFAHRVRGCIVRGLDGAGTRRIRAIAAEELGSTLSEAVLGAVFAGNLQRLLSTGRAELQEPHMGRTSTVSDAARAGTARLCTNWDTA